MIQIDQLGMPATPPEPPACAVENARGNGVATEQELIGAGMLACQENLPRRAERGGMPGFGGPLAAIGAAMQLECDADLGARAGDGDNVYGGAMVPDDRVLYLAMVAAPAMATLRQPLAGKFPALPAIKPRTKAECTRRCGTDGFCDPSSPLGCGGEYCQAMPDRL
ncbi:hypothetical protein AAKU55_003614 [Oxalobacteraceae bacterium GrIS 1.11]